VGEKDDLRAAALRFDMHVNVHRQAGVGAALVMDIHGSPPKK